MEDDPNAPNGPIDAELVDNDESTPTASGGEAKPDHTMGMLCHLLSLIQLLGVPLGNILGPLVIWLTKKESDPFVDECGKEAINFQISMTLYFVVSALLILVFIGVFLVVAVMIVNIAYTIIASIHASEGKVYRYPFSIRFLK